MDKEKLEKANNLKLLFRNGDCGKCRLQFLKQQAKELLEVKIKGCGDTFYSCDEFCLCSCNNNCICPKCQEEDNQADKILKEIING